MWLLLTACLGSSDDTTPTDPAEYGEVLSTTLVGALGDIVADGQRIFLCGDDGVRVFDSGDPSGPVLDSSYYTATPCYTADIINNRVLMGFLDGFRSFAPNNMLVRGEHFTDFAVEALDVEAGANRAWLSGTDEAGQVWLEEVAYREDAAMSTRQLVAVDVAAPVALEGVPDGVLLLDADGVLHAFDETLSPLGQWTAETQGGGLFMALGDGDHAYVSLGAGGMSIVDVSDLAVLSEVGRWPGDGGATFDVLLVSTTLYVGRPGALRVLDVSEPSEPAAIGADDIELDGTPTHIWVDNRYAYLADADAGLLSIVSIGR
jgi:hypothetical protein